MYFYWVGMTINEYLKEYSNFGRVNAHVVEPFWEIVYEFVVILELAVTLLYWGLYSIDPKLVISGKLTEIDYVTDVWFHGGIIGVLLIDFVFNRHFTVLSTKWALCKWMSFGFFYYSIHIKHHQLYDKYLYGFFGKMSDTQ